MTDTHFTLIHTTLANSCSTFTQGGYVMWQMRGCSHTTQGTNIRSRWGPRTDVKCCLESHRRKLLFIVVYMRALRSNKGRTADGPSWLKWVIFVYLP